jgi:nitrosocyanin
VRRVLVALLAAAALATAACGNITTPNTSGASAASTASIAGGSGTQATSAGSAAANTGSQYAAYYKADGNATIAAGQTLTMTLGTLSFTPNTLTVAKGTPVSIKIVNSSSLNHNFSLDAFNVNQNVDAGATQTVTFTPSQAGTYYFYCNVPGHAQAGMVGKLTVQ